MVVMDAAVEDSVGFLDDVTMLRDQGSPADTAAAVDTNVGLDAIVVGSDVANDNGAADAVELTDAAYGDLPVSHDGEQPIDAPGDDGGVSDIRIPCTSADTDCPAGFTCESTSKAGSYCRPPQKCSLDGLTDLNDLVRALLTDDSELPIFVKIAATVKMGPKTCSMEQCGAGECCRDCYASMTVADSEIPIVIHAADGSTSATCTGKDSSDGSWCRELECKPLVPLETYVIWGSIRIHSPIELVMDGACLLSDAQTAVD